MKVRKLEKFQNKMELKGCKWSSLNAKGTEGPLSHPCWERGNSPNSKIEWARGFSVPLAFKLDHLQPLEPLLFWTFPHFFTFILGSPFLLPQRANNQKRQFFQLQNWTRQRVLSAWGIQTAPFAALWAHFLLKFFQLFPFHTGELILITSEG